MYIMYVNGGVASGVKNPWYGMELSSRQVNLAPENLLKSGGGCNYSKEDAET